MGKGIFVTGTGTDIGKTYVTALIVKKLADAGIRTGYYKAALSGAKSIGDSDAGYVKKIAGITQEDTSLLSYLYQNAVSPHLAAQIEGNPVDPEKIKKVKALNLNTLVIADAGLGTINAVVLTIEYIRNHGMGVKGVILNHYVGGIMQEDNARMIEELTGIPVIAKVKDGDGELAIDIEKLKKIYN